MVDVINTYVNDRDELVSVKGNQQKVQSGSRYDVNKKSLYGEYSDVEIRVHELMKKRPDLFCRIITNSNKVVSMEKLDTKRFNLKFQNFVQNKINPLNKTDAQYPIKTYRDLLLGKKNNENLKIIFDVFNSKGMNQMLCKKWNQNCENELLNCIPFIQDFIKLKLEIFKYFSKFDILIEDEIELDLHKFNFAFIKGTNQIRCFDPITILEIEDDTDDESYTEYNR